MKKSVIIFFALSMLFLTSAVFAQQNNAQKLSGPELALKRIEAKLDQLDKKVDALAEGKEEIMKELQNVKIWIRRY
jgi:peptidoglycan hydrolase CwlO-like protein